LKKKDFDVVSLLFLDVILDIIFFIFFIVMFLIIRIILLIKIFVLVYFIMICANLLLLRILRTLELNLIIVILKEIKKNRCETNAFAARFNNINRSIFSNN